MYFVGYFLFSLIFCISAHQPIDRIYINTFDGTADEVNYRLPNDTIPESYDITLTTNVHNNVDDFTGEAIIKIKVLKKTSSITLHHRKLTITSVNLIAQGTGSKVNEDDGTYDDVTEFLTIKCKRELTVDESLFLTITYTGKLRDDMGGFYKSSYVDSSGTRKYLATTQFEQTDARHAFPCYDEPAIKALFTITIKNDASYSAVSNMEVNGTPTISNGVKTTTFKQTPLTSTYLIAFIVSDFQSKDTAAADQKIPQRVFANPNLVNQADYALSEGVTILDAIAKYVQVPYSLSKMDQVAVPDFRAGAMENWGLVTYREEMLLYDADIHLPSRQLSVTTTIAHEFAHQWFGNLVSPKWWTYTWLNEGFATIFEAIGTKLAHPDWDMWTYFVSSKVQPVLRVDAQPGSRPMTTYKEKANELSLLFDSISYAKAGSVIRMFMNVLGEETFQKGLKNYLTLYSYKDAEENNLFECLDAVAKDDKKIPDSVNIKDLFGSWSNQKGFPLLTITRNYEDGSVKISQSKYDWLPSNVTDSSLWWIPYNVATKNNPVFNITLPDDWLEKKESKVIKSGDINGLTWTNDEWLLVNRQQTGYYRILYDETNYEKLQNELNDGSDIETIHPINRAQILDDVHEFVNSSRLSAKHLCNTMAYLKKETSYAPWVTAKKVISELKEKLQVSEKLDSFQNFVSNLVKPYYTKLTLTEEKDEVIFNKMARNTAVNLACEYGVEECIKETYTKFQQMINGTKQPQNVRGLIVSNGIRKATDDEILQLWNLFVKNPSNDERQEILSSLGNIQNEETLAFYLKQSIAVDENVKISNPERLMIITSILRGGQKGLKATIQFLSNETQLASVKALCDYANCNPIPNILSNIAARVLTKEMSDLFDTLLELAKQKGMIEQSEIDSNKNKINAQIAWQANELKTFEADFFAGRCSGSSIVAFPALLLILFGLTRWNFL